jgi:photosystem II stability/assembly factor-like uncharacterized protein
MKKLILFSAAGVWLSVSCSPLLAQNWTTMMKDQNTNVHAVQKAFNKWYSAYKKSNPEATEEKDGPYEKFKSWEWLMATRTYPSGNRPVAGTIAKQYSDYIKGSSADMHSARHNVSSAANWTYSGNDSVPEYGGDGRVNYLRFMPGNNNIIFACGPTGGLWKTTDGGATWSTKTDNLVDMSVSDIAIDPSNTNIMYISTGDGDGIYGGYTTLSTVGVLKSTDGGVTWNPTGFTYPQATTGPTFSTVNQLLLNQTNTSIILAGTSFGLYRTTNAGTTWNQVDTGDFRSIEAEPFHSSVVYASTYNGEFYRSVDAGATWTYITSGLPAQTSANRIKIGVSPADSNFVYVVVGQTGTYLSTDRGQTFTQMSTTDQIGYQWWYTMSLCVSPTNADSLLEGGLDNYASADSGKTWTHVSSWVGNGNRYVHADIHDITPLPGSGSHYFVACDGGVFESNSSADGWSDISNNLEIGAMYNVGPSGSTAGLWLSGWQDNGVNVSSPFWEEVNGGDGMVSFIDYSNDNTMYSENYGGDFQISTDGGATWNGITTGLPNSGGPWITKWCQNPQNPTSLYGGYEFLYNTTNQGTSWTQISTWGNSGSDISAICVDPSDSNIIYAAQPGIIEVTNNNGVSWTDITGTLPVDSAGISGITCDPRDPARVWVTFSGYSGTSKVFESKDSGMTWTNISSGLPNLPVNCIIFQKGSPHESIYIGMDAGCYYRDTLLGSWVSYNTGLPNVIVNDLQIFYPGNTLIAATYGRGAWTSPTYVTGINTISDNNGSFKVYPNPTSGSVNLTADFSKNGDYLISVYNMIGQRVYSYSANITGHYSSTLNLSEYGKGVYLIQIAGQGQTMEKKIVVN